MKISRRDVGLLIGALALGAVIGFLIGRDRPEPEGVPPPPLETVEFSSPKTLRTPSRVRLFTWTGADSVPEIQYRGMPDHVSWTDADETTLQSLAPTETLYRWGFAAPIKWKNVFASAFVVDFAATLDPVQPALTIVNFSPPNATPPQDRGIKSLQGYLKSGTLSLFVLTIFQDGDRDGNVFPPTHDNDCP